MKFSFIDLNKDMVTAEYRQLGCMDIGGTRTSSSSLEFNFGMY